MSPLSPWTTTAAVLTIGSAAVLAAALTNWWIAGRRVHALQLAHITAVKEAQAQGAPAPPSPIGSPAWERARAWVALSQVAAHLVAVLTAFVALVLGVLLVVG